jgi:hypothetical protein
LPETLFAEQNSAHGAGLDCREIEAAAHPALAKSPWPPARFSRPTVRSMLRIAHKSK